MATTLSINGRKQDVEAAPDTPLLWVLRDELGLTGTKYGCGAALCGICTVHLDGKPVRSCLTTIGEVKGREVTTIEGAKGRVAEAVIEAWVRLEVAQCGFCQPGQVMSAIALLAGKQKPTDQDIDEAMAGNICRCATYHRIRAAIHEAAKALG